MSTRLRLSDAEFEIINQYRGIKDQCDKANIDIRDVPDGWLKIDGASLRFKNKAYRSEGEFLTEINFDTLIQKFIQPIKFDFIKKETTHFFDKLDYTDVHVGMNVNENGFGLYGGKWDEEEIFIRLDLMINHVLQNQKSDTLLITEYGDFMDGWDGETVRKGHHLPQNMDNEKAFDVGLTFKVKLIDALAPHYKKIICHNICNDNHAGSFGYCVNSSFKTIAEIKYSHVKVINVRKFIDHYKYGRHTFIITHGKDGKNLKFGFKPKLDPVQIEKIKNYIDEHHLLIEGDEKINFTKGDSHQDIVDESTSDAFNYNNLPAFSPSSEWVQTNYKKGKSGFKFFNYKENGAKSIHPFDFEWNTNRVEETINYNQLN